MTSTAQAPGTGVKPAQDDKSKKGDEKAAAESVFEDPNAKPAEGAKPAEPAKPAAEPAADVEGAAAPAAGTICRRRLRTATAGFGRRSTQIGRQSLLLSSA